MGDSTKELSILYEFLKKKYEYLIHQANSHTLTIQEIISEILNYYESIIGYMPGNVYWIDGEGQGIGCNQNVLNLFGFQSMDQFKGITFEEMGNIANWDPKVTKQFKEDTLAVFKTGQPKLGIKEPPLTLPNGELIYFLTSRVPVFNGKGRVIAVVGISTDITKRLEAEEREKKALQEVAAALAEAKEQEKFTQVACQVAHDLRSPLASLLMIIKSCTEIPEMERVALREAAISMGDIANNLLNQYKFKNEEIASESEESQPFLLSATCFQLLTDKKFQYKELPVKFDFEFNEEGPFAFIKIESTAFKRMMSNLMNNAVDALEGNSGTVTLHLEATPQSVIITVQDDGKGIPKEVEEKIMEGISFTEGKQEGYGLGLQQVRDTLNRYGGTISIKSTLRKGTKMRMEFPRVGAPSWFAEKIELYPEDVVIVLDDDASIHGAWRTRFQKLTKKSLQLQIHHFEKGDEAIHFIQSLKEEDLKKIFLLTDFELLQQELNGLHVVERTKAKRAILVTSHYANPLVLERAKKLKVKILPKQLASDIPILMKKSIAQESNFPTKSADIILVDDDSNFSNILMRYVFSNKTVQYFQTPEKFLEEVMDYSKETPIYLDNQFKSGRFRGVDIAKNLHEKGFRHLYLLSGTVFKSGELPDYLTFVSKEDITKLRNI